MAKQIQPGDLDQRVRLERVTRAPDGMGGGAETWAEVATVWAKVNAYAAGEAREGDTLREDVVYAVIIRGRAELGLTSADRLVWLRTGGNRVLQIKGVRDEGERKAYLRLDCAKGPVA